MIERISDDKKNSELLPSDRVYLARLPERPKINDYIDALFTDFFECRGDRAGKEDRSICGGIALFDGEPVTVIGHRKGRTLEENLSCNFGMPGPEGYRKAMRLMKEAERFRRPVITFVDTPGAYPGIDAEKYGQSGAIADNLAYMSMIETPVITIITGEGNSGGALAIAVANKVYMLENSVYSILSPEGFCSIMWKNASKVREACSMMKCTAEDLCGAGIADGIINEPEGGAQNDFAKISENVRKILVRDIRYYSKMCGSEIAEERQKKFRNIDVRYIGQ